MVVAVGVAVGVAVADVVKAVALVVHSAAAWVRVPTESGTEIRHWGTPCTEGGSKVWTGSQWKTGDVKPNLDP